MMLSFYSFGNLKILSDINIIYFFNYIYNKFNN